MLSVKQYVHIGEQKEGAPEDAPLPNQSGGERGLPAVSGVFERYVIVLQSLVQLCKPFKRLHDRNVPTYKFPIKQAEDILRWPICLSLAFFPTCHALNVNAENTSQGFLSHIHFVAEKPKLIAVETLLLFHEHQANGAMQPFYILYFNAVPSRSAYWYIPIN